MKSIEIVSKRYGRRVYVIDDCDSWALGYRWSFQSAGNYARLLRWGVPLEQVPGYAVRDTVKAEGGKPRRMKLHIAIAGRVPGMVVDHIDGDTTNNRRSNLRHVTMAQSNMNRRRSCHKRTCAFKGVQKIKDKYIAVLAASGKLYYGRMRVNPADASLDYDMLSIRYHGEFGRLSGAA